ncbi:MAG: metal ABC transporter permease [Caldisericaceae bacterium]
MIYPFLVRAFASGVIVALLSAFIGVFVVLRRMAFFAHAVAHASLTGVAIGLVANSNPFVSAIAFGALTGVSVAYLIEKSKLFVDTIIGVLLPSTMALGLIIISFIRSYKPDLMSYLFGDILAVSTQDVIIISIIAFVSFLFILIFFNEITLVSLDEEWAKVRGLNVRLINYIFYILLSLIVVIGTKVAGIILVSALIVIPPASAQNVARSFKETMILSVVFGFASAVFGTSISYILNIPTGPSIVAILSLIFLITILFRRKK